MAKSTSKTKKDFMAVIETGGKQYKVSQGSILDIEKLAIAEKSTQVYFDKVLLLTSNSKTQVGQPYVKNALIKGSLLNTAKGKKLIVFKFKPKTGYKVKNHHRQWFTTVKIEDFELKTAAKIPATKTTTPPAKAPTNKTSGTTKKSTAKKKS